ncbi:MAG: TonB-dependent receptor, partial [Pseudomonadota bacterium]
SDLGLARRPDFGTVTLFGTPAPEKFWDLNQARDHFSDNQQWGVSGRLDYEFDLLDFVAIVSYRDVQADFTTDQGEGPVDFILGTIGAESETFSAELQLKSNNESWLDWIAGFYYFDNTAGTFPFMLSGPGFTGSTVGAPGGPFSVLDRTNVQDTQSYSVFGEGVIHLGDKTRLTLGARYTIDQRDFTSDTTFIQVGTDALIPTPTVNLDEDFKEPSWRVVLDHRVWEDVLVYASYGRGFKSGIFNLFSPAGDPVEAETLDAYEVGFKSEWFGNTFRLNGAAFYYEYEDLQLTTQSEGQSVLTNAAEAETMGVEFEAIAALGEHFEFNANISLTDTEFKDFPGAELTESNPILAPCPAGPPFPNPNCVSFGNAAGNELPRAPE